MRFYKNIVLGCVMLILIDGACLGMESGAVLFSPNLYDFSVRSEPPSPGFSAGTSSSEHFCRDFPSPEYQPIGSVDKFFNPLAFPVGQPFYIDLLINESLDNNSDNVELEKILHDLVDVFDKNKQHLSNAIFLYLKHYLLPSTSSGGFLLGSCFLHEPVSEQRLKLFLDCMVPIFVGENGTGSIIFLYSLVFINKLKQKGFCIDEHNIATVFMASLMLAEAFSCDEDYRLQYWKKIFHIGKHILKAIKIEALSALNYDCRVLDIELVVMAAELFRLDSAVLDTPREVSGRRNQPKNLKAIFNDLLACPDDMLFCFLSCHVVEHFDFGLSRDPNLSFYSWVKHLFEAGLIQNKLNCISSLFLIKRYSVLKGIKIEYENIFRLFLMGAQFSKAILNQQINDLEVLSNITRSDDLEGSPFRYSAENIRRFLHEFETTLSS